MLYLCPLVSLATHETNNAQATEKGLKNKKYEITNDLKPFLEILFCKQVARASFYTIPPFPSLQLVTQLHYMPQFI